MCKLKICTLHILDLGLGPDLGLDLGLGPHLGPRAGPASRPREPTPRAGPASRPREPAPRAWTWIWAWIWAWAWAAPPKIEFLDVIFDAAISEGNFQVLTGVQIRFLAKRKTAL
jgi:hypothetical protein